jgi:hypothetical protein
MSVGSEIFRRLRIRQAFDNDERSAYGNDKLLKNIQKDAQQAFRYILNIRGVHAAYITNVNRPSYSITSQEFQLLNWKFKNPTGTITWNDLNFTIVELFSTDLVDSIGGVLMNKLTNRSYMMPDTIDSFNMKDLSKSDLMEALGNIKIELLNPDGKTVEEWELHNAWIKSLTFSSLNYSSDTLNNAQVVVSYDWAHLIYHDDRGAEIRY